MPRNYWLTRGSRCRLATLYASLLIAALALILPAGMASAKGQSGNKGHNGGNDIISTTRNYVETFYPLWFTHLQFNVVPHNQFIGPDRISPVYQGVVAINDDTLYASSPIDVTTAPVKLTVPETDAGYSVLLLDAYGNIYPSGVPSKAAGVDTPTTTYALVAPDYDGGPVPGTTLVRLPYPFMVLIFRADRFSNGVDMTTEADAFRAALALNDLKTEIRSVDEFAVPFKTIADTLIRRHPVTFLRQLQVAVLDPSQRPPLTRREQKLSDDFDALFVNGPGLSPAEEEAFAQGAWTAHDALISNYLYNVDDNNWIHFTNIGDWGKNALDRASITEFIQYGNGSDTAAYYHAFLDGNGAPLEGGGAPLEESQLEGIVEDDLLQGVVEPPGYVMTFPPGGAPEASRFWSLTAYTPDAIELIPNESEKYVVASYTPGLETNADGSLSIYISKTKPADVPEANWLPVSDRAFNLMLRVYGVVPKSDVAKNKYVPPPVERW